jgi:hypothetical protein
MWWGMVRGSLRQQAVTLMVMPQGRNGQAPSCAGVTRKKKIGRFSPEKPADGDAM